MTIAVFGLGYVGLVNIACLAEKGHRLKGCDIKGGKVRQLQSGESPIYEPGLGDLIAQHVASGQITAHHTASEAVEGADVAIVCVGTPSLADGTVELGYIRNTLIELSQQAKAHASLRHIIIRSTIPPGTINDLARPLFAEQPGVHVYFVPEFLREGSAIPDFFHSARTVIGTEGGSEAPAEIQALFDGPETGPVFCVDYVTAEFIKYVDNAWHAIKVAFANEAYSIGHAFGVDVPEANRIFLEDKHLNICEKYLKPGLPFGGSCLPKDVRAINSLAARSGVQAPLLGSMLASNAYHKERLAEFVLSTCGSDVLLLGLTFKDNTDDLRESPLVDLARSIVAAGRNLTIVDPHVNLESLRTQFPDLAPHLAPSMRALPPAGTPLSVVVSKSLELPEGLVAREAVDLSFAGSDIVGEEQHRWVMG